MPKHRSITQRLRHARSQPAQVEILNEWSSSWRDEADRILRKLRTSVVESDYDAQCRFTGELKTCMEKRFTGLDNFDHLATWKASQAASCELIHELELAIADNDPCELTDIISQLSTQNQERIRLLKLRIPEIATRLASDHQTH